MAYGYWGYLIDGNFIPLGDLISGSLSISTYIKSPCFHYHKNAAKLGLPKITQYFSHLKMLGCQTGNTTYAAYYVFELKVGANQHISALKKQLSCGGVKFI